MAGFGQWGGSPFGAPAMSPFGALGNPGGYQPDPATMALQEQLMRGSPGMGALPPPQPPMNVSPFAFAPGVASGMGQAIRPGMMAMGEYPLQMQPGTPSPEAANAPAPGAAPAGPAPQVPPSLQHVAGSGFVMPSGDGPSASSIERQRKLADAMMQRGMSDQPIQHWAQGVGKLAQTAAGAYLNNQLDAKEKEATKREREMIAGLLGMGGASSQPMAGQPQTGQQAIAQATGGSLLEQGKRAIAKVESDGSGGYSALGPVTRTGDRAYGKYQVMGANIPSWTKDALGYSMTPAQFRASPEAQEKVFEHRFGGYLQRFGNMQDAASMWFSGRPFAGNNRSDGYNSVPQYVGKVMAAMPGGGQAPASPQGGPQAAPQGQPVGMPQQGGPSPQQLLMASMMVRDPRMQQVLQMQAQMAAQQQRVNYQTLPDGTILALDPMGRRPPTPVYQAQTKPTYGVIGKDQFGNEQYGFIDPVTRQIQPTQLPGGQAPQGATPAGPAPAPGQQQQAPAMLGAPSPAAPAGVPAPPPGVDPKVWRTEQTKKLANPDKLTEVQSKDVGFYSRGAQANELLGQKEGDLLNTTQAVMGATPLVGNQLTSQKYQAAQQSARDFLAVILRKDTGAAVTPQEFSMYGDIFIPKPGDKPEVVAQKRDARSRALEGIRSGLGSVQQIVEFARPKARPENAPPQIGQVIDGYRFKGGKPGDQKNWEKVN